ncbi:high-potential iron-sulfur protein [Photobacterium damselae]|uniref:high-potential iron-sulfur protein n=1 Tax=Photobacterium damselae TaxID=38293 RepID=UPI002542FA19
MKKEPNRRQFLKLGLGSVIGMTVGGKILLQPVSAEEIPHVSPEDPQAKALRYVDKSTVDGQICANCALIQGKDGDEWRPCAIFPGKLVNANGWCSAYAPKPA